MNVSVILSGGTGTRFGNDLPKQYSMLCGKEIIGYVANSLKQSSQSNKTLIVSAEKDMERLSAAYGTECTVGGDTHNASVKNGLDHIKSNYPNCKKVLFADAARPFLASNTVDEYFAMLDDFDAVITAKHITDSLGCDGKQFVDRSPYYLIQKPEAFCFEMLYNSFSANSSATAIVQQIPLNAKIKKNFITGYNLKITYPSDLPLAEYMIREGK
ncbi:MAG: 2-C-methyl-D-erythritol 4-phosphate cytidylyltransferase [Fibromonadaceae bacterium]|jgi:2-C-methyl-D-erythritol 4-phosphate cytidylyltransferase|nr:2-C-methyl-D-erythritol 4-phosphate cytidylyltransferase [Fibromonadaceae bacterium]